MPWHPLWQKANVVPAEEFVSLQEARKELGLRFVGTVNMRMAHDHLEGAVLGKGSPEIGVTRTSLDAEVRWWQQATRMQRWRRHVRTVVFMF